ncbi:MAG: TonB-dependent receptor plug domain-containing protein [Acidobacteriota bacterium]
MPVSAFRGRVQSAALALCALLFALTPALLSAASVRGIVTDASGARVAGANIAMINKGRIVASAVSLADGSFQITTGVKGRFFLVVSAQTFRQLQTPDFYAGHFDSIQRNLVLEPAWVHQSIVVTATGAPTPQPQTSSATTVLDQSQLGLRTNLLDSLRQVPGAFVAQDGQYGAQTSLFLRGGDSNDTMVLLDGVDATDLGGGFDFGPLSTTAIESAEVYRGPDTNLYGGGADSGVVSLTTPHGTTSFPSVLLTGDVGNLHTSREELEVAGAHSRLDYLGAFSWFQTSNALPNDEYHLATSAANVGWQLTGNTLLRATAHYFVDATGVPNAWDFYHVADNATEKDQNLFLSGLLVNQTTANFRNSFRYGLTRKREQFNRWLQAGSGTFDSYGDSYGYPVTITGANGYSVTGQALLDYTPTAAFQIVNNRDQYVYEGDLFPTPHLTAVIGFRYERERGAQPGGPYPVAFRDNYEYLASVHGDFKTRFFYTLAGSIEHYSLFGTQTSPRGGASFYLLRPRTGVFSGTRLLLNFGEGVREPSLTDQFYSLYSFLEQNGGQSTVQQLHISPLAMPQDRTWEGGVEQDFLSQHIIFKTTFFHNEFGRQIEYVGFQLVPELLPNLTPAQQNQLEGFLQSSGAYELSLNSEAYRSMGIESTVQSGIGRDLLLRGGYTYLDAVVQRSFTNADYALLGPLPTYDGIPIGAYSPLQGARPFRRPPHTGFLGVTFSTSTITGVFNANFVSRSDDSDFLAGSAYGANPNALLLPNRNLDFGYAGVDLGGSYQFMGWLGIEAQANNLLSNQHMAPIGYPSLPMTFRAGLRVNWAAHIPHL